MRCQHRTGCYSAANTRLMQRLVGHHLHRRAQNESGIPLGLGVVASHHPPASDLRRPARALSGQPPLGRPSRGKPRLVLVTSCTDRRTHDVLKQHHVHAMCHRTTQPGRCSAIVKVFEPTAQPVERNAPESSSTAASAQSPCRTWAPELAGVHAPRAQRFAVVLDPLSMQNPGSTPTPAMRHGCGTGTCDSQTMLSSTS